MDHSWAVFVARSHVLLRWIALWLYMIYFVVRHILVNTTWVIFGIYLVCIIVTRLLVGGISAECCAIVVILLLTWRIIIYISTLGRRLTRFYQVILTLCCIGFSLLLRQHFSICLTVHRCTFTALFLAHWFRLSFIYIHSHLTGFQTAWFLRFVLISRD